MTLKQVVIVGGGQSGFQTAASLRQEGFDGRILLVDPQEGLPYQRPPLSKTYMEGKVASQTLVFRPRKFFDDNRIELVTGRAEKLDRASRSIELACGSRLKYDHLVLCMGAKGRRLAVEGAELDGVLELRELADADAIRSRLPGASSVVVIGAGFVGLEFAAVARAAGASVHVVEQAIRPLTRAVSPATSEFVTEAFVRRGITFSFGAAVVRMLGVNGAVSGVELSDGRILPANLVLVGIGIVPNIGIAEDAGLTVENGIRVNEHLLTDDPAVSAIGDCASFPCSRSGRRLRLESVQNAADHAKVVAARLAGRAEAYVALPWFWSDQGGLKLQMAGLAEADDASVVLKSPDAEALSVLRFRSDRLVAVECVNRPGDFVVGRKLLSRGTALAPGQASRLDFSMRDWEAQERAN